MHIYKTQMFISKCEMHTGEFKTNFRVFQTINFLTLLRWLHSITTYFQFKLGFAKEN